MLPLSPYFRLPREPHPQGDWSREPAPVDGGLIWRMVNLLPRLSTSPAEESHALLASVVVDFEVILCQVRDWMSLLVECHHTHIYQPAYHTYCETGTLRPS